VDDEFESGETVIVDPASHFNPRTLGKVKRVTKRFIELEDGSKFSAVSSREYGSSGFRAPSIRKATEADIARVKDEIRRHRALQSLTNRRKDEFEGVPTDNLVMAAALLESGS
jgi:hypothetical protein